MCCYVGKATKIFLCLVAALLVAGLVLGFSLARHTWGANRAQTDCRWPDCQQQGPAYGDPLLPATAGAATTPPANPLTQPAVAAFPGVASSSSSSASAAAPPPTGVPYFGPPGPFVVGLGPAAHA
ncbi:hypothetical protein GQ55_7G294400 [Panicum hallii var. hallii]|uniref:Uncharacterized protein n=1 Tax=Panicum hallii var. hallii TaxID=1504633 RepID=A0A2T7D0B5_9POAL|nr:hypothetical protein GQ55_7G294400 [Panicum hallii var. hallii]